VVDFGERPQQSCTRFRHLGQFGAGMMGFFIGNELIGSAALLLVCGGLLFDQSGAQR
jgi:hypothetical protein